MSKKVAIIGGGASGLLCAIECAKESCKVDVFEQNDKCAKKILVSGNGRCNITNKNLTTYDYFGQNPHFAKDAIEGFGYKEFSNFASSFGLILNTLDDGRAYPLSNESKSVATLLTTYATNLGVKIYTSTKIKNIKELLKNYDAVVVATGSCAAEHLGGCADGYEFAKEFGHNIIATYPSLVQLHLNSTIAHKMSGVKTQGEVTLLVNNKKDISICGDILFTNYGVSGFAILDISQRASKALLEYAKVGISINLLPSYNTQKLSTHITNLAKAMPNLSVFDILIGLVPLKIAQGILQTLVISKSTKIDTKLSKKIANQMLNWRFEVTSTHGFRHSEVSGGGVDVSEINPKTFESLKQKNLYFCGEVLDIVGKRGGYNFAFAWASGYLCAKDIIK
ncbi:FAD-dependent pyridine nucleotide-disulfide oxidoreductase (HI0933 domain) [Sulfurimonas hongkongensis]|uniref:FAD-dependent pyridine nucleotide-disulfide oxidoreductase (HI0933 domain) n=1 Tax=Sulfurimonas hongkongensis TaxID=1172190 RepID=T0J2Y3_9BACT|nr:NAD(P)/FAD-dependent oxidoreductase [Sulfurimonas hongkongensis]EQB35410.1 FAD-dependent pyridine nucleotide-disulfide oxidoreductase (HI0933 domain) [Sulfurimonas hongkongensis]